MFNITNSSATQQEAQDTVNTTVYGSYLYGADNHNVANNNFAITDPSTWSTGLDNAGKFIVSAAVSGVNSFYNTGVTVANWFGADAQEANTEQQLMELDEDIGKYYKENKSAADLGGFLISSLIPGLAGVKLLNAGQKVLRVAAETGAIGANLARYTGLLTPAVETYTNLAKADFALSSATYSSLTGNAIKAISAGYGQAALESAAFEIAVAATQFKSPVLDQNDAFDIGKNILLGTVTGGIIGGAFSNAAIVGTIKKSAKQFNEAEKLFSNTSDITGLTPAQRIIARQEKLDTIPAVPTQEDILNGSFTQAQSLIKGIAPNELPGVASSISTKLARLKDETTNSLQLKNRADFNELTGNKDLELGNMLADMSAAVPLDQSIANLEHLHSIGRLSTKISNDDKVRKFSTSYINLKGENAGKITLDEPIPLTIADTVTSSKAVNEYVTAKNFKLDSVWDASKSTDILEADARYIWASNLKESLKNGAVIGEYDIPLIEKAVFDKLDNITAVTSGGNQYSINTYDDILQHLKVSKQEVATNLLNASKAGIKLNTDQIAKITNVTTKYLEGELSDTLTKDIFARQVQKDAYVDQLKKTNQWTQEKEDAYYTTPSVIKAVYDTKKLQDVDGNIISGLAYIKAEQKARLDTVNNVIARNVPSEYLSRLTHPTDGMLLNSNRLGTGAGAITYSNSEYGSLGAWSEVTGKAAADISKSFKDSTAVSLEASLHKITTDQEVAIGFESINKFIQSTSEKYGFNPEGTGLEPLKILDYKAKLAKGKKDIIEPVLQEGAPAFYPIPNKDVYKAWFDRTQLTGNRTQAYSEIRNAQGLEDIKDFRALRPIRPDPKDYPYFAMVIDDKITGVGHASMIHAASEKELDALIAKVPSNLNVIKKSQSIEFHKAYGDYSFDQTLHENYIDSTLKSNGVNNPYFIKTDPAKIAKSLLEDHLRSDDIFTRELLNAKYEKEFNFLRQQGEQFTSAATSKYTGSYRDIENSVNNPYYSYIKNALNIRQSTDNPFVAGFLSLSDKLDRAVSRTWQGITDTFTAAKSPEDLDKINSLLSKNGIKSAYYDSATELLANHIAPKGDLNKFIGRANSILATLVTRLDFLNSINNTVGATVLYGSETKSFLRAMEGVNPEIAGELGGLLKTSAPAYVSLKGDMGDQILTQGKLILNAIKNFTNKESTNLAGEKLNAFYARNGWSTKITDQFREMLDNITLTGSESSSVLSNKMAEAFKKAKVFAEVGEKYTGNKLAEEFNRFISADTMRQMTDIGIKAGKITPEEQVAYINSFVNRTQGNTLASQRPLMFQGSIGQAIGLFQSYQFNIMQQLFRHVSEGANKDAAMLLGLQTTMYGMNGLPAFNFLNTHIIGTASGNPAHTDAYTATYGIAGKSIGDMVLYGIPSNMLRGNLYTRGDINPRQVTVIPTNPLDIPFVNATISTYDNVKNTVTKIANGGNIWQSMLQGIEHNGLNRPLAGLAQTAQAFDGGAVFSTTTRGNISGANDLFTWATAVRLSGGKPLDDAIANDAVFRISSYQTADRDRMEKLNSAIKSTNIGEGNLGINADVDQINKFAKEYASIGGKQSNFNKYMLKQIREANTDRANKIMENLRNPYAQKMQQIMGGYERMDGRITANTGSLNLTEESGNE